MPQYKRLNEKTDGLAEIKEFNRIAREDLRKHIGDRYPGAIRPAFRKLGKMTKSGKLVLDNPNVKYTRDKYRMTQEEFASLLGIGVGTLRSWEQGRRKPGGPATVLLRIADCYPHIMYDLRSAHGVRRK